jgi:DNA modification methylase
MFQVLNGDNLELLKSFPDNHFDAVVTDPPYGLGQEPNAVEVMHAWCNNGFHEVKGRGFMGKEWDAFVPQPNFWREIFRVLKPGGHVLAFYGTRTYDWGVMAMRFAGFEVRDCIQWLYGSGFPKSHNISKAIDKMYGAEREVVANPLLKKQTGQDAGKGLVGAKSRLDFITPTPSTEDAKEWDGWGSALKPANEPIVLARKPLEKGLSIAENVLKYGTGGINIDGCRVGNEGATKRSHQSEYPKKENGTEDRSGHWARVGHEIEELNKGRFPANIILTHHPECVCRGLKKVKGSRCEKPSDCKTSTGAMADAFKNIQGDRPPRGFGDENNEETIEDWICIDGGFINSPCIYLDGYEISIFNCQYYFEIIQRHRVNSHNLATLYTHNKDKYSFWDYETFHDLGWKQLPSFRVYYQFLSHFYDVLVQTFQVYDKLSVQQCNDVLDALNHLLELLHNHVYQHLDPLSNESDYYPDNLVKHILENKEFYSLFLNKISYRNADILFQELEQNDFRDNILENKIFEDFLSYLTKMELNNSCILHLRQMLFCLSLQINFSNQIYYKKFELPTCPIRIMDEQSGTTKSGKVKDDKLGYEGHSNTSFIRGISNASNQHGDTGGASRFFYCAKASKSERNKGLEGFEQKENKHSTYGIHSDEGLIHNGRNPENRSRTMSNFHPTVKPVKLMQYLVRLITPADGIVLDPFCGSGTTGIACKLQGIRFVGMEQDAEYCKIAEARINNWDDAEEDEIEIISEKKDDNSTYEVDKNNTFNTPKQLSLF